MPAKLTPKKQEESSHSFDLNTKALIDAEIESIMDVLDRPKAQPILLSVAALTTPADVYSTLDGSKRARVKPVVQDYLDMEEPYYESSYQRDLEKAMEDSMQTLEDETLVRSMNDGCTGLGKRKQK